MKPALAALALCFYAAAVPGRGTAPGTAARTRQRRRPTATPCSEQPLAFKRKGP